MPQILILWKQSLPCCHQKMVGGWGRGGSGGKYCIRKVMENNQEMEGGKMKAFGALAFCIVVHPAIELNAIHEMHL